VVSDAPDETPFDDFRVEDEPMPDGRTIHYYVWRPRAEGEELEANPAPTVPDGPADV
jgi:hypothetical protein